MNDSLQMFRIRGENIFYNRTSMISPEPSIEKVIANVSAFKVDIANKGWQFRYILWKAFNHTISCGYGNLRGDYDLCGKMYETFTKASSHAS